jgi:2-dehydro-3-deoxyphosphooctonate aldolase (KDO 8-P synthase)
MVKNALKVPVVTDVHESNQCEEVAAVVDVLQIPAFLCRQTDLLVAAAKTGKPVKVKKGQFMAPEDMKYAVDKVRGEGNNNVFLTSAAPVLDITIWWWICDRFPSCAVYSCCL